MKIYLLYFFTLISSSAAFASERVIDTVSLNGIWKFKTDLYKKGDSEGWFKSVNGKENWDDIIVPGNWDLKNEYADYTGDAWYSYSFKAGDNWNDKNVRLVFQSVYNDSEVWLNGIKIGTNHLGFMQFAFDINSYILPGKNNHLVLKVNNVVKLGAIWNWGGIRRPVWLEVTNPVRINNVFVDAIPDLNYRTSAIKFKVDVANYSKNAIEPSYSIDIFYKKKIIYSSGVKKSISLEVNDSTSITNELSLSIANTHLWHFDRPELYTFCVSLYQGKKLMHLFRDRFGIRKVEVDGMKLRLNGEEIRPVGFNLVPEDRITGNTLPADRIKRMVDMMKESGANMARISHMPLPKEFLDYLDEKGIMTFEEVSLWGKDIRVDPTNFLPKLMLEKLIAQQYNHPSVIGWSVGNEIGSIKINPLASQYIKGALEHAKRLDPNRLAVYVSNSAQEQADDPAAFADLIMLNSYGSLAIDAEKTHKNIPGKPVFFAEFGGNLNDEDPDKSRLAFNKMLNPVRGRSYVIGASLWTFNDYRSMYWSSTPSWATPPSGNRAWGVVNTFLQKKNSYNQIRKEYLPVIISDIYIDENTKKISGGLTVKTRNVLDFPAYVVDGYKITVTSQSGEIVNATQDISLPVLKPGDPGKNCNFSLNVKSRTGFLKIQLVDPQQYSRFDTVIFFSKPDVPTIKSIHTAASSARIVFDKKPLATSYSLKYGIGGLTTESPQTVNDFIDIKNLKAKSNYQFQIIAHNNAGTQSTPMNTFLLDEDELPPIIWSIEPVKNGFFISFASDPQDHLYEVQYGTEAGKYEKLLTFSNKGVLQIPDLESSKNYFFRMRRLMQWGFASEWTHEMLIRPM